MFIQSILSFIFNMTSPNSVCARLKPGRSNWSLKWLISPPALLILSFASAPRVMASEIPAPSSPILDSTIPVDNSTYGLRSRSDYNLSIHYSPISSWLPGKMGVNLATQQGPDWTWEFEWTRKSYSAKLFEVDFGKVTDERYGIQSRWYLSRSNSFHLIMGLFKSSFSFELGSSYLSRISGSPSLTVFKFESIGPQIGFANRWQWENGITLGVDWFIIYIPALAKTSDDSALQQVTNEEDRKNLNSAMSLIQNIPQFDIFRLNLGYSF